MNGQTKLQWIPYVHGVTEKADDAWVILDLDGKGKFSKDRIVNKQNSFWRFVKYFIPIPPDPTPPEAKPVDEAENAFEEWEGEGSSEAAPYRPSTKESFKAGFNAAKSINK